MWAPVQRDDPCVVDHFVENGHGFSSLKNLDVVVVRAGKHGRAGGGSDDTALPQVAVLRSCWNTRAPGRERGGPFLPFFGKWRDLAVLRIYDQRRAAGPDRLGAEIPPESIIGAADV